MSSRASSLVRLGLAGAAVAGGVALAAPAHAADNLPYTCQYGLGEATGSFATTASLTSNTDGRNISLSQDFEHRVHGSITLPQEYADLLRSTGYGGMSLGEVKLETTVEGLSGPHTVWMYMNDTDIPETGPITLPGEGEGWPIFAQRPGTYLVTAGSFEFVPGLAPPSADFLRCSPTGGADMTIGTFTVPGAATPSPTPSTTPSAERPKVVQTDFADEGPSAALPLTALGALLLAVGGAVALGRSRAAMRFRRH